MMMFGDFKYFNFRFRRKTVLMINNNEIIEEIETSGVAAELRWN